MNNRSLFLLFAAIGLVGIVLGHDSLEIVAFFKKAFSLIAKYWFPVYICLVFVSSILVIILCRWRPITEEQSISQECCDDAREQLYEWLDQNVLSHGNYCEFESLLDRLESKLEEHLREYPRDVRDPMIKDCWVYAKKARQLHPVQN